MKLQLKMTFLLLKDRKRIVQSVWVKMTPIPLECLTPYNQKKNKWALIHLISLAQLALTLSQMSSKKLTKRISSTLWSTLWKRDHYQMETHSSHNRVTQFSTRKSVKPLKSLLWRWVIPILQRSSRLSLKRVLTHSQSGRLTRPTDHLTRPNQTLTSQSPRKMSLKNLVTVAAKISKKKIHHLRKLQCRLLKNLNKSPELN